MPEAFDPSGDGLSKKEKKRRVRQRLQELLAELQVSLQEKMIKKQTREKLRSLAEQEALYFDILVARKIIMWCSNASRLIPCKGTVNNISIVEAVCIGVQGKIEDTFCAHLLYQIAELLKAEGEEGTGEKASGVRFYERWCSDYVKENGASANRQEMTKKWQSVRVCGRIVRLLELRVYVFMNGNRSVHGSCMRFVTAGDNGARQIDSVGE